MAFDVLDKFESTESRAAKPTESTSMFSEAYSMLSNQSFKASEQFGSSQTDVNQMFGALELFDSQAPANAVNDVTNDTTTREPVSFDRHKDKPRPETPFEPTAEFAGKVIDNIKEFDVPGHVKQIPGEVQRQLGEIAHAWGF